MSPPSRARLRARALAEDRRLASLTSVWHLSRMALFLLRARLGHVVTRVQQRRDKTDATVWTRVAGRSHLATPVDGFRSTTASTLCLNGVVAALETAALPHRVVSSPPERSVVVVENIDEALSAIAESSDLWYTTKGRGTRRVRPGSARTVEDPTTVFRAWATRDGRFVAGSDVGVTFTTQAPAETGALNFAIDAVFTWVDGSDPLWQQRKQARATGQLDGLHETAANDARYASFDELRYAMRSIEMYAPWIRHIFLVTDQQVPQWLDTSNPRVTVVDHREIFDDPDALPTFNSHAIEARLHHIPRLAEHYIYFNDDVFLARALPPSFFFTPDGRPRVFLADDEIDAGPITSADPPVVAAAKNNRDLLRELTGYELRHKLKHVAHPQSRSLAVELEQRAPEQFRATSHSPFRNPRDLSVASSLLPHYALATGCGVSGLTAHFYADVASPELRWRLPLLQEGRAVDFVCLNATTWSSAPTARLAQNLEWLLPMTSPTQGFVEGVQHDLD